MQIKAWFKRVLGLKATWSEHRSKGLVTDVPLTCPACKAQIDLAIRVAGKSGSRIVPRDGDIGQCHVCRAVLEFLGNQLIMVTDETWAKVPPRFKAKIAGDKKGEDSWHR